jgi:hypothetical protein
MPKIKRTGEKVTWKEFFKRWKQGMEEVTPLQQTQVNQLGFITIFIGVIWGIIFSIRLKQWWLSIILTGSLIISSTSFLANWQKKTILKRIDKLMKNEQEITI